jgi:hypothetical protein
MMDIHSLHTIVFYLRAQASMRAPENDDGGVLFQAANMIDVWRCEQERHADDDLT